MQSQERIDGAFDLKVSRTARRKVRIVRKFNLPIAWYEKVGVGVQEFLIPITREVGAVHLSECEPNCDPILRRLVQNRSGAFIDVGANIGQYFLKFRAAGGRGRYVGFEASLEVAAYLKSIVRINGRDGDVVLPVALGSEAGMSTLFVNAVYGTGGSIVEGFRPDDIYMTVQPVTTIDGDTALATLGVEEISFMKMDVEGAELDVLQGFGETLSNVKPPVLFESLPPKLLFADQSLSPETVEFRRGRTAALDKLLHEQGYELHQILADGTTAPCENLSAADVKTLEEANFLAVSPESRRSLGL